MSFINTVAPRALPGLMAGAMLLAVPATAFAQDGRIDVVDTGDTAWLLAASALVLIAAIPGIALFNAGRIDARNVLSVLFQPLAIVAAVSLAWIAAGYTVAFGDVTRGWLGSGNAWMLISLGNVREGVNVPESAFAFYQVLVAGLAASLLCGAWAGRARFGWAVAFASLWSIVAYAPVAHWLRGGGWLSASVGTLDFAGGLTMATCAGVSAIVAAMLVGRRRAETAEPGFSASVSLLGAGLAWIGWLGLAGGAALAANDDAASVLINTHAAACAGGLGWLALDRFRRGGKPGAADFASGLLAGLAAILAGALYVSPGAAMVIGLAGTLAARAARALLRRFTAIDDTLDVFALFGASGAAGSIMLGLFLSPGLGGVGYDTGMTMIAQLLAQVIGVGIVAVWSIFVTAILAIMVSMLVPMRVGEDAEAEGLDVASHGDHA
ncbi:ammonium transporter [Novosphingobium album (ex Liu et al. 2023)]|uniref:Ammonium transporter n=1 Tax=Novosphingobium album (ex Liu et al. 2023) TaxID=3031130 RepID=A0ABT5WW70_9SPHN|nr:ammonium transporter [Novosphingobium album (ex Liu et al. 2023)]MDE8654155.1 ammonium transporter [Novosphingobium album (ex Liu et al. 2023)]